MHLSRSDLHDLPLTPQRQRSSQISGPQPAAFKTLHWQRATCFSGRTKGVSFTNGGQVKDVFHTLLKVEPCNFSVLVLYLIRCQAMWSKLGYRPFCLLINSPHSHANNNGHEHVLPFGMMFLPLPVCKLFGGHLQ